MEQARFDQLLNELDSNSLETLKNKNAKYAPDDIILDNRIEAEEVIRQMRVIIDTYQMATVADLYDLVGLTGPHTAHKYGWTNLRNADVVRVREGYILKFPKALPIN